MKKNLFELELTNTCNTNCIMCPVVDMKRKRGFMTRDTFELIVKKGRDYGVRTIRFCGLGEPLLHEDFCYFLSYVKKHTLCSTELITNGSLLTKEIVAQLVTQKLDFLSISFPSLIGKNYERMMKGIAFEEASKRVLYAIRKLKEASDTQIKVTGVLTDINCDEKARLEQFWTKEGVDCIELSTPHNRGGYLKDSASLTLLTQFEVVSNSNLTKSLCPWPLRSFFIAWDGSVFLCCCDLEGECRVGNVHCDSFGKIESKQEVMCIAQPNLCKRCSYQSARGLTKKEIQK